MAREAADDARARAAADVTVLILLGHLTVHDSPMRDARNVRPRARDQRETEYGHNDDGREARRGGRRARRARTTRDASRGWARGDASRGGARVGDGRRGVARARRSSDGRDAVRARGAYVL